jgi:hypothetical protein
MMAVSFAGFFLLVSEIAVILRRSPSSASLEGCWEVQAAILRGRPAVQLHRRTRISSDNGEAVAQG